MVKQITRKEWIEALKSGKYKQAKGYLHFDEGFCCLGVVCDLAEVPVIGNEDGVHIYRFEQYGDWVEKRGMISDPFIQKLDLDGHIPNIGNLADVLAELNDGGHTFEQIADLLIFDTWIRGLN